MKEYNIGDKVWWATCGTREVTIDCPICFRKKKVTLILGNGEQVETNCDYCTSGLSEALGYTNEYQRFSEVKEITITGKEVSEDEDGKKIEYRYSNYCLYPNVNIFETKEEAESRVQEMIKEYEDSEVTRLAHRKRSNQTHYSWSVGYHKKRLKDAQREVEYHSRKLTNK